MTHCDLVINKPTLPFPNYFGKNEVLEQNATVNYCHSRRKKERVDKITVWPTAVDAPQSTAGQPLVICLPPRH